LLLLSDRWSLLGDPYYGASFKKAIFEQNNVILRDLIVDEIYTVILLFMPQVKVERRDIKVRSDKQYLYADIEALYKPDNTINLYTLVMTTNDAIA
jgi:phage baseplate assembly protein W